MGTTLLNRLVSAAATGGAVALANDSVAQATHVNSGIQDAYRPGQALVSSGVGFATGGAAGGVAEALVAGRRAVANYQIAKAIRDTDLPFMSPTPAARVAADAPVQGEVSQLITGKMTREGDTLTITVASLRSRTVKAEASSTAELAARRPSTLDRIVDEANLVAAEGGAVSEAQRKLLGQNLPVVQRRGARQNEFARTEFERNQKYLVQQWERNTGSTWPVQEGRAATPHHIIPLESGGANKWWNLMPTFGRLPNHSLPGVPGPHAKGGVLRTTIQAPRSQLEPGTTTDIRK